MGAAYCTGWIFRHNFVYSGDLRTSVNFTTERFTISPFDLFNGFALLCQGFVVLLPDTVILFA